MVQFGASQSQDRQERRKLINEIKDDLKVQMTRIAEYHVEQGLTVIRSQIRKIESENELDKKRIVENFENEIKNVMEYFKK